MAKEASGRIPGRLLRLRRPPRYTGPRAIQLEQSALAAALFTTKARGGWNR